MPWKDPKRLDAHKKDMLRGKVDQLPLVTSSENDSATPPGDSESKSDSCSSATNKRELHGDTCYVTTVTVTTSASPALPKVLKSHDDSPSHRTYRLSHHESPSLTATNPIISYEKNKSVRIVVKEPTVDASSPIDHGKRRSRPLEDGGDSVVANWRTSFVEKDRDVNNWVANQHKPPSKHEFTTTMEKLKDDEEGVKVRPLLETTWRSSSRASVLDEPPSSDDCQRSTSTLVNTNSSKVGKSTSECQRGCLALLCGVSVVVGSAVCLRLPGLLLAFGPGSFLAAFGVCLLFVAAPLAYLECGLAQFSNNSVIGIWSLVPLARGIGWSTVVACLYWGATTAGLAAPWFHYVVEENDPSILQVSNECRLQNGSSFDAVFYYRSCVYNISSDWETGLDLSLTWTLPAGLITILMLSSVSVAGGPGLLAFISVTGSVLALTGYGVQLYIAVTELTSREGASFMKTFFPLMRVFIPDPQTLIKPQVWIAAMSQALLCLGPGVGMLLNHSANNIFRHPLKRHLWTLIGFTILSTILVTVTTILEAKIFTDYQVSKREAYDVLEVSGDDNDTYFSLPSISLRGFNDSTFFYFDPESQQGSCMLYSYSFSDFSCSSIAPGLVKGIPFILSSHMTSSSLKEYPSWLTTVLSNLIFVGFLGAGAATSCVCMHVGVVAAREARSLPPALAAIILMGVLSLVAAPMSTQAGASLIQLVDHDVLMPGLLWPSIATLISLAIWHGVQKIRKDMTFMLESVVSWIWLPVWAVFLPLLLLGLTIWAFVIDWQELGLVEGPNWRIAIVWSLRLGLLVAMPVTAIIVINSQLAYGIKDKVLCSLQSSREWGDWGPQDPIEHHNWRRWREDETQSYASLERRLASKSRPLTYTHSTLSSSSSSTLARLRAKYRGQTQACDL